MKDDNPYFWADIGPDYVEGERNPNEHCFTKCVVGDRKP